MIPFNRPFVTGEEWVYIQEAIDSHHLSGNGPFTQRCQAWLEERLGCRKAFLTSSGTAALEMAAILTEIQPGDEIVMPSYTFPSTANAFVLLGGVPVFVDVRSDTLNLDESKIEAAITDRTKAIVAVHYAGVGCEMEAIMASAERHGLIVIEDAAQAVLSTYRHRPLGSIGHLAVLSFHETKVLHSGEGGALLVNDPKFIQRAEVVWEKGTNRGSFFRGEVNQYSWMDVGSSFPPSEITAAFLWAQLERADWILQTRRGIWTRYHQSFTKLENSGRVRLPTLPPECEHNAHLYYLLVRRPEDRPAFLEGLTRAGVNALFHYIPLHSSPAGRKYGRIHGDLTRTEDLSHRVVRLPLWIGIGEDHIRQVEAAVFQALGIPIS